MLINHASSPYDKSMFQLNSTTDTEWK
jgi:hypothetical protein